jgi:hypothetical protein
MYNDQSESSELHVLLNDTMAGLCSVTNESPEEEALLAAIVSESAPPIGHTRYRLFGHQVGCSITLPLRSDL